MLTFCPTCANMLLVDHSPYGGGLKMYCQTCPYVYDITTTIRSEVKCDTKEVDDVLGGEDVEERGQDEATCPKCDHGQAYFMQIQVVRRTSRCRPSTSAASAVTSGGTDEMVGARHRWRRPRGGGGGRRGAIAAKPRASSDA